MILKNKESGEEVEVKHWFLRMATIRRRVFAWANALKVYLDSCGRTHRLVMITLTYHYGDDWRANAINQFMKRIKKELRYKDHRQKKMIDPILGYLWVAETQERGVVHYHVLLLVERGTRIAKPDDAGWWNYGSTKIETARTPYYVCAYVGKEHQKKGELPKGARVCGAHIRKGAIDAAAMAEYKAACAPKWVREVRNYLVENEMMAREAIIGRIGAKWKMDTLFGQMLSESAYELVSWRECGGMGL